MSVWRLRIGAALVWLALMLWLVRFEAFPELFTHTLAGYEGLLAKDLLVSDSWMRLSYEGDPIGYSHTSIDINETSADHRYEVKNRVHLRLKLMGLLQDVHVDTTTLLDAVYALQSFSFSLASKGYDARVEGTRVRDTHFDVTFRTGSILQHTELDIPDDVVLYSPMTEMALKQLAPGQELSMLTLDPATLTTSKILIRALRKESLVVQGETQEATVLQTEFRGMAVTTWVDSSGKVLRQETPFGWNMERCSPEDAFEAVKGAKETDDMLAGMAIPCTRVIENPRHCQRLRVRLRGVRFSVSDLESNRQHVDAVEDAFTDLTIDAGTIPASLPREAAAPPAAMKPFLASSLTIQADAPPIMAKAAEIVAGTDDPVVRAKRILAWVDTEVGNSMKVSLPSALEVLQTLEGDCNEHTYLFVALARASGIPAKVVVGLAYHEGAFYYHAWPAVYLGAWVEMDPTWGQTGVDATHIALAEGELTSQLQVVRTMGQLAIEILEP